jgi:hypothetical protein
VLLTVYVAFAIALTLPALLLVRSVSLLVTADFGFRSDRVFATPLALPPSEYPPVRAARFVDQVLQGLRGQPGITRAGWVSTLPLQGGFTSLLQRSGSKVGIVATLHAATPGALATLGVPVRRGRDFDAREAAGAAPSVVLDERAARQLGVDVGGLVDVAVGDLRAAEVVGVVADVPHDDPAKLQLPAVYVPLVRWPQAEGTIVVLAERADPGGLVRDLVSSQDRALAPVVTAPLAEHVRRSLARFRAAAWLLGAAALVALGLSGVGVYGLLSLLVARSTREVGIRIALGATPGSVARVLVRATLVSGGIGLLLGLALGIAATAPLDSYLYRVRSLDLWSLALAALVSVALALAAAWVPARRAMRVEPMSALRSE